MMTPGAQNTAIRTTSHSTADVAALVVTFYGIDKMASTLYEQLYRSLTGTEESAPVPNEWESRDGDTFLCRFDHDIGGTTTIQLVLTAHEDTIAAWNSMRSQLESHLSYSGVTKTWLGYSLVYYGVLAPDSDADEALKGSLSAVRKLHSTESLRSRAKADISDLRLWLLGVPDQDDGFGAATVYVALNLAGSKKEENDAFLGEVLLGPGASLLMPDLIAHQGYYHMRQYRSGDLELRYNEAVENLQEMTDQLLSNLGQQHALQNNSEQQLEIRRQRQTDTSHLLDNLARAYNPLARFVPLLNTMYISLRRQIYNYSIWQSKLNQSEILEFHRIYLETIKNDLEMKVADGRDVLQTADRATSMAQVQLNADGLQIEQARDSRQQQIAREQENRQWWTGTLIAVVGVAIGLQGILDRDILGKLLGLLSIPRPLSSNSLIQLGAQASVVLVSALLTVLAVRWIKNRG